MISSICFTRFRFILALLIVGIVGTPLTHASERPNKKCNAVMNFVRKCCQSTDVAAATIFAGGVCLHSGSSNALVSGIGMVHVGCGAVSLLVAACKKEKFSRALDHSITTVINNTPARLRISLQPQGPWSLSAKPSEEHVKNIKVTSQNNTLRFELQNSSHTIPESAIIHCILPRLQVVEKTGRGTIAFDSTIDNTEHTVFFIITPRYDTSRVHFTTSRPHSSATSFFENSAKEGSDADAFAGIYL